MPPSAASLRDFLSEAEPAAGGTLWGADVAVVLADLSRRTSLGGQPAELDGRSILIRTRDQLTTALALIELDGVARRLVICPHDVPRQYLPGIVADAEVDTLVGDPGSLERDNLAIERAIACDPALTPADVLQAERRETEWVLLTSGTTGAPKMVAHSLHSLAGAIDPGGAPGADIVWSTFYDIRRYGGMQIFLRAVLGGASLVVGGVDEPVGDFLLRLGQRKVTHISGTPSHWRRALMSPAARTIAPRYVRLSGEIADQAILDNLRAFFPQSSVGHAYASTEAGVGFEVTDGLEGFPASFLNRSGGVEMRILDGSLRVRSAGTARRYLGPGAPALQDAEGFVDTGDMLERRGDRYYFLGRRSGVINVGGQKVHPEEVEAAINCHADVRMSLVRPRNNPITGAIVVAEVVLKENGARESDSGRPARLRREILQSCRERLPPYKIPAIIRFVSALDMASTGKLRRHHA